MNVKEIITKFFLAGKRLVKVIKVNGNTSFIKI